MRTIVKHNGLGCYDMLHPSDKTEGFHLKFGEDKVITFTFKEDDAPNFRLHNMHVHLMHVEDIIDYLAQHKSVKYLLCTAHNGIEEKPHEERIKLAREWAEENRYDDNKAHIEVIDGIIGKLQEKLRSEERAKKSLEEECQEIELVHEGSMK